MNVIKHTKTSIICSIIVFVCFFYTTFWYTLHNPETEYIYISFQKKLEQKYDFNQKINIIHKLNEALIDLTRKNNFSKKKQELIQDLLSLNDNFLQQLQETQNKELFENNLQANNNKKTINTFSITKQMENVSYDTNDIFLENGVWYAYIFDAYKFFKEPEKLTVKDLNYNNIDTKTDLLFLQENGNLWFVTQNNYQKVKLIDDNTIGNIANKYNFLKEIKDDKNTSNIDSDILFWELKEKTKSLTHELKKQEKIETIYNYILANTRYSTNIDFSNKESLKHSEIFSGIQTFKNKNGVCEWYAKLFTYMLSFAWIQDSEVMRWYVIDAPDFPNIWHAWVRIGNNYYDPTFDDPIGNEKTRTKEEYKFFALPKDLLYTNRFSYNNTPEELKTSSMEYRKNFINQQLAKLVDTYKGKNYLLLKIFEIKKEHNIPYNSKIDLSNLWKILPMKEVRNFSFTQWWKKYSIKTLKYFSIKNNTIEELLEQINYNFSEYYFFKWYTSDTEYEYRLAYDVEII